jgi:hypothetical protein
LIRVCIIGWASLPARDSISFLWPLLLNWGATIPFETLRHALPAQYLDSSKSLFNRSTFDISAALHAIPVAFANISSSDTTIFHNVFDLKIT